MAGKFKLRYRGSVYGGSTLRQSFNNYLDLLQQAGEEEALDVAEEIVKEAKDRVNVRSGALRDSGSVIMENRIKKGFKWLIQFSAVKDLYGEGSGYNYAYIQHEDPYNTGGAGSEIDRGWHYLQIPFEKHMREFTKKLAETMRRV